MEAKEKKGGGGRRVEKNNSLGILVSVTTQRRIFLVFCPTV